jgi:hypothetical protein
MVKRTAVVVTFILLFSAVAVFAWITFDPSTGTGFVGKGDVQLAYGWNNAQLQKNALDVKFSFDSLETYQAVCEWYTGPDANRKQHDVTHTRSTGIVGGLDGDPRQVKGQKQFTGFILKGYSGGVTEGGGVVPVVGQPCQGGGLDNATNTDKTAGIWVSVEQTGASGGLTATWNGISHTLSNPIVP